MRLLKTGATGLVFAATLLAATAASAQTLEEKFEAKLAEEWVAKSGWITDYDEAQKQAADSGKLIFAYFTRSYAY